MRILLVADEPCKSYWDYYDESKLKGFDLILSAGDLPPEYLSFLVTFANCPLLYVHGNHDAKYQEKEVSDTDLANISIQRRRCRRGRRKSAFRL